MINYDSIISVFNEKGTLLKWLKKVEKALKESVLTNVEVLQGESNSFAFKFTFQDNTSVTTDYVTIEPNITATLLQNYIEGSDTIVVNLNELQNKLIVKLDEEYKKTLATNAQIIDLQNNKIEKTDGVITSNLIANDSVMTSKIPDNAITSVKIANHQITDDKLMIEISNKINNSMQLPTTAPTNTELVGINTNKAQTNINIGEGLSLENGTLKATGGKNSSYNPNLLLNDEMTINQRGKSVYYGPSTYGTDRWLLVDDYAFMRINTNSQWAIGIEDSDGAAEREILSQKIENYKTLAGKTVTLTLSYSNLTESVAGTTQLSLYDGVKTETVALTSSGTAILTTTISSNNDRVEVRIKTSSTGIDTSLVFKYCKLELGSSSTPLVPKNIGIALTECQRYYQKLSTFGCSNIPTTTTSFDAPINLLTSLRATPTLKLSAKPLIIGNGNSISSTSYSIASIKNNKAIINLQCTQSMTLNQVYVLSDAMAELDAEMY